MIYAARLAEIGFMKGRSSDHCGHSPGIRLHREFDTGGLGAASRTSLREIGD